MTQFPSRASLFDNLFIFCSTNKWWNDSNLSDSLYLYDQQHSSITLSQQRWAMEQDDGTRLFSARCSSPLPSFTWSGSLLSAVLYKVPTSHNRSHLRDSGFNSVFHFLKLFSLHEHLVVFLTFQLLAKLSGVVFGKWPKERLFIWRPISVLCAVFRCSFKFYYELLFYAV